MLNSSRELLTHHLNRRWHAVNANLVCRRPTNIGKVTVDREIFVKGNFRAEKFRAKFFSLSGGIHENLTLVTKFIIIKKNVTRKMDECEWALCVRDYHVFHEIWETAIGEVLACEKQPRNAKDGYAVAVKWTELSLRIASCTSQFA